MGIYPDANHGAGILTMKHLGVVYGRYNELVNGGFNGLETNL